MRKLTYISAVVILLFIAVGYLLPRQVVVKKEITIDAPIETVYKQVSDLHNWDEWSGLVPDEPDKNMQYLTNTCEADTGFSWTTNGFDPQKRRLLITGSSWCDSLTTNMSFADDNIASANFYFCEKDGTTVVRWEFTTELESNIVGRWRGPFIHNIVAPDIKNGLRQLKLVSEDLQSVNTAQLTDLEKQ